MLSSKQRKDLEIFRKAEHAAFLEEGRKAMERLEAGTRVAERQRRQREKILRGLKVPKSGGSVSRSGNGGNGGSGEPKVP